jgi:hypothetical protein
LFILLGKSMTNLSTKRKIIAEYRILRRKCERTPTILDLRNNGCQKLERAIYKKFGNLTNLKKAANIIEDKKPPGYWTVARVVSELRIFCRANKKAVQEEAIGPLLLQKGKKKLCSAVRESGGFRKLNETFNLGLNLSKKAMNEEQILEELKIVQQFGYIITGPLLKKIGRNHIRSKRLLP